MEVGHVSVDDTVRAASPMPKTLLNAASNPMTASGDATADSMSVKRLHTRKDKPLLFLFWEGDYG